MEKKYCKNCYWFKASQEGDGFENGECMKDSPKEKYRVKSDDFCKDFEDKEK